MKRAALIGTIVGGVIVLGGGAAVGANLAASSAPDADPTPSISISETPAGDATVETEPTEPVDDTESTLSEEDEIFLAYVKQETPTWTATVLPDMTDDEKIAAGQQACEQIAAGVELITLRLVDGEEPSEMGDYLDSSAIFNGALTAYCPELMVDPEAD